jgi:hypothetical protein
MFIRATKASEETNIKANAEAVGTTIQADSQGMPKA